MQALYKYTIISLYKRYILAKPKQSCLQQNMAINRQLQPQTSVVIPLWAKKRQVFLDEVMLAGSLILHSTTWLRRKHPNGPGGNYNLA